MLGFNVTDKNGSIYHFKNWRDENGTELERAKKLFSDTKISLKQISNATEIPYETLKRYSSGANPLEGAKWSRVHALANYYDVQIVANAMSMGDVKDIQDLISDMFKFLTRHYLGHDVSHPQDSADLVTDETIKQMKQIVTSDPTAIYKIYLVATKRMNKQSN